MIKEFTCYRRIGIEKLFTDDVVYSFFAECKVVMWEMGKLSGIKCKETAYFVISFDETNEECPCLVEYAVIPELKASGDSLYYVMEEPELKENEKKLTFDKYQKKHNKLKGILFEQYGSSAEKELGNPELQKKIRKFVEAPDAFRKFDEEVCGRVLGQPNLSEITYNVFMWLSALAKGQSFKQNAIICGPTGCGKTETYRVIRDILRRDIGIIPVIQLDATKLTPNGCTGTNVNYALKELCKLKTSGVGIVVIDEFDKLLLPALNSEGDNISALTQSQLLTVLEGIEYEAKGCGKIHTDYTLFIGAGAFQAVRDKKEEKTKSTIGFVSSAGEDTGDDITTTDIIESGAIPELIGRFTTTINLKKLDKAAVAEIAGRYVKEFSEQMDCTIELGEDAVDWIYDRYEESSFGCRTIRSDIWNLIVDLGIDIELSKEESTERPVIVIGAGEAVIRKENCT